MSEQILDTPKGVINDTPPPKGGSRRTMLVAGSVVAGLVLGGVFLMLRQQSEQVTVDFVASASAAEQAVGSDAGVDAAADPDASAEGGATQAEPKQRASLTSRDPFAPIVFKAPAAPEPKAKSKKAEPAAAPTPAGPKGGTISAVVISPKGDSAKLKLDGKRYNVDEGEAFAKVYRLYDIFNDDCAGFLYGDQNAVVCEGDTVTMG